MDCLGNGDDTCEYLRRNVEQEIDRNIDRIKEIKLWELDETVPLSNNKFYHVKCKIYFEYIGFKS